MKKIPFLFFFFLAGCQISPPKSLQTDIKQIQTTLPTHWQWTLEQARGEQPIKWWHSYQNDELNSLVEKALTNNYSLKAAGFTLEQAKLEQENHLLEQKPRINSGLNTSYSTNLSHLDLYKSYGGNIGVSYLVDYLGKNPLLMAKQEAEIKATGEDLQVARQAVIGAVVNRFLELAYLEDRLRLIREQLKFARKNQSFAVTKYQAGSISRLEQLQTQQTVQDLEQKHQQLLIERKEQQTALGAILGENRSVEIKVQGLDKLTLTIPSAGIPAHLLAQRPDLRAAQYRLQQSLANIDLAERDFYPQITLGGSTGFSATKLLQLLKNPTLAVTLGLDLPFLRRAEKVLAKRRTEISYQQALSQFQQKLGEALSETQQILLGMEKLKIEEKYLRQKSHQIQEIEQLTRARYQAGAISQQTLLEKEEESRQQEEALLNNRFQQFQQSVRLHLALGGNLE